VTGMDCLDIGATDGLVSFGLEKLGAKSVVATDRVECTGFSIVRDLLSSRVELIKPVEISTLYRAMGQRRFDLIVCAGVYTTCLTRSKRSWSAGPYSSRMACSLWSRR
jgi:hypothetical protein